MFDVERWTLGRCAKRAEFGLGTRRGRRTNEG
jgi:hypothetical protein